MASILLYHGRTDRAEEMDSWGFDGPRLEGVAWLVVTYKDLFRVKFKDHESFNAALAATGWESWDLLTLNMRFENDLVVAGGKYYGDWSLDT
jgi:hypothetical protein